MIREDFENINAKEMAEIAETVENTVIVVSTFENGKFLFSRAFDSSEYGTDFGTFAKYYAEAITRNFPTFETVTA